MSAPGLETGLFHPCLTLSRTAYTASWGRIPSGLDEPRCSRLAHEPMGRPKAEETPAATQTPSPCELSRGSSFIKNGSRGESCRGPRGGEHSGPGGCLAARSGQGSSCRHRGQKGSAKFGYLVDLYVVCCTRPAATSRNMQKNTIF